MNGPAHNARPLSRTPHQSGAFFASTPHDLATLAAHLRAGGLVGVPSETVYGLAALATDETALSQVFALKQRPTTDPLIVHLGEAHFPADYAAWSAAAQKLADAFWPGPLTIVVPKRAVIPDLATAGRPSVALRCPAHPAFLGLLEAVAAPLAAPSANPFGYLSPTEAQHVRDGFPEANLPIINGGPCQIGLESTVLDLRDATTPAILRPGAISGDEISGILGCPVAVQEPPPTSVAESQAAPGLLSRHYQPRTPLTLHPHGLPEDDPQAAFLHLRQPSPALAALPNHLWFSETGDLATIARALYRVLRKADAQGWQQLHLEWPTGEHPLVAALQNRLQRAAAG